MTDSNTPVDINTTDDLDAFEDHFFQRETPTEKESAVEEVEDEDTEEEVTETELDTEEDTDAEEQEAAAEDEDEEEEEPEEAPKPKGRKSAKERIDELTTEKYQLRRELEALRKDFEDSRVRREEVKEEPVSLREQLSPNAPDPDAVDDKGEAIYPLGEFDPRYVTDLTKFVLAEERKSQKEADEKERSEKQMEAARDEIRSKWTQNLEEAEKDEPEIRENILHLTDAFKDVEPVYGEYIASVIMSSEYGPQMMNYLSQNIGEAQKIVASGPAAATLALGRLEARFIKSPAKEEQKQQKKVSAAKDPPEQRVRGNSGRFAVQPDTDDLDAFEREFFKSPKKPF